VTLASLISGNEQMTFFNNHGFTSCSSKTGRSRVPS
jgi:hypothetical protein